MRLLLILAGVFLANFIFAANPPDVIINEIAWMGSEVSYNDEWLVGIKHSLYLSPPSLCLGRD